ncbi:enoyl-CoA-hydratase DpgB [Streptomyces olivochromogenes]|uniref:enoyl-CoA-hydratase DpgB n=1 Tax=Streptomyces olivochromogenes TaxID=1963 RepID=UPI001F180E5C|nr:enoyl-CoA-hydratase DpgB [Streptomyces olivochromogenes]MCF3135740.1 enoyl-CoA hydratase/isomerase family protein [Streptomyces olivochromogenes]
MTTPSAVPGQIDPALVLRIDGSRPLTAELVAELDALCARVEDTAEPGVAVLRLSGAPDPQWTQDLAVPLVNKWERALRRLERLDIATLAVATGDCGGTALEALLAADYRIAGPGLRMLLPAGPDGAWPGMALYRLANQIGVGVTRRIVLRGLPVPAPRALELQLVDEVAVDPEAALAQAAAQMGAVPGGGMAMRRQLMLDATTTSFEDALGSHLAACDRVLRREPAGAAS